jgi:hypothetical protein
MCTDMNPTDSLPVSLAARQRLRDQQHQEIERLADVLAAQRRVAAEQAKTATVIAKAEAAIAVQQSELDDRVVTLIAISGLNRVAMLLERRESELTRLVRVRRRASMS